MVFPEHSLGKITQTGRFGIIQKRFPPFSPRTFFLLVLGTLTFSTTTSKHLMVQLLKLCKTTSLKQSLNIGRLSATQSPLCCLILDRNYFKHWGKKPQNFSLSLAYMYCKTCQRNTGYQLDNIISPPHYKLHKTSPSCSNTEVKP